MNSAVGGQTRAVRPASCILQPPPPPHPRQLLTPINGKLHFPRDLCFAFFSKLPTARNGESLAKRVLFSKESWGS